MKDETLGLWLSPCKKDRHILQNTIFLTRKTTTTTTKNCFKLSPVSALDSSIFHTHTSNSQVHHATSEAKHSMQNGTGSSVLPSKLLAKFTVISLSY